MKTKISVVIPAYNAEESISKTLDSIISQTYKAFEIIVVDDGSTDNLKELLKKNHSSVTYIYQDNGGPAKARNTGIDKATGEYIAFLDADDIWLPNHLENANTFFINNKDIKWYASGYRNLNTKKLDKIENVYSGSHLQNNIIDNYFEAASKLPSIVFTGAVIVKKEFLLSVDSFNETWKYGEDLHLWFKLGLKKPMVGYNKEITAIYNNNAKSLTNSNNKFNYENSLEIFFDCYSRSLSVDNFSSKKLLTIWISGLLKNVILNNQKKLLFAINLCFKKILTPKQKIIIIFGIITPYFAINLLNITRGYLQNKFFRNNLAL